MNKRKDLRKKLNQIKRGIATKKLKKKELTEEQKENEKEGKKNVKLKKEGK